MPKKKSVRKRPKRKVSLATRRKISRGVKAYWRNLDKLSQKSGISTSKIRKQLSRNITGTGVYNYLKRRKLKGGKRQYDIIITAKDTKGRLYSHVIRGIGGRNQKQLKSNIAHITNKQLGAWRLYLRKYGVRFKHSRFKRVSELKVSFRERPL